MTAQKKRKHVKKLLGNKPTFKWQVNNRRQRVQTLAFVLVFAAIGSYFLLQSFALDNTKNIPKKGPAVSDSRGKLILAGQQLQIAAADVKQNPGKRAEFQPKLQEIAKTRKTELLELIKSNPQQARQFILPDDVLATLKELGADVEKPTSLTGKYVFKQVDDETGDHIYSLITLTDGSTYTLNTNQTMPQITPGSTIKAPGHIIDDQLLVAVAPGSEEEVSHTALAANDPVTSTGSTQSAPITTVVAAAITSTPGLINDAIIMANFGGGSTPVDKAKVQAIYNGTPGADVASYVTENSYGKDSLAATYFGVYDFPSISCSDQNSQTRTTAMKDAASRESSLAAFTDITYIVNCNGQSFALSDGTVKGAYMSSGLDVHGAAHELAHTRGNGMKHGAYLACAPEVFVSPINASFDDQSCLNAEYQDPYDVLGDKVAHMSTSHKLEAGYLDSSRVATVTAQGSTTHTLLPYEQNSGLVGLKIPRGNAGYFTVEYRQPVGMDSFITDLAKCSKCNANKGALVRLAGVTLGGPGGGTDSAIIDTTPGTNANPSTYWPAGDGNDGTLLPGQSFTDPDFNITIKVISADTAGLRVEVTLASAACTNFAPTVSAPTPLSQTATPGQAKTYTVTVTNKDSSGCPANKFRFVPSSPFAGKYVYMAATPDYFSLAPGASTNLVLTATSSINAPDSSTFYSPGSIISRSYGVSPAVIPNLTYQVATPADTTPPSQPTNLTAKSLGSAAVSLDWNASTDSGGVIGYSISVSSGTSAETSDLSYIQLALLPSTSYTFAVKAFDHKRNFSTAATVTVTTPARTDMVPPALASNLNVTASDHSYIASWSRPYDNVGIVCFTPSSGVFSNSCATAANQASLAGRLPSQTKRDLAIVAFDGDGNYSSSEKLTYATAVQGDPAAPSRPQQLYSTSHTSNGTFLTWQASTDNKAIAGYHIYRGAGKIAFSTTNSFTDPIPTGNNYRVQAVDVDGSLSPISSDFWVPGGNGGTSDITPPTATITSPSNNAILAGPITLQANAQDNVGVTSVQYYIDGQYIGQANSGSAFPLVLDTTKYNDGPHWLVAEAYDAKSNTGANTPINIIINNNNNDLTPPIVSLTSPVADANVSGSVNLSATASDNVAVTKVDFQVDGVTIASDTTPPYSYDWDTMVVTNGNHNLTALAYDAANNSSSSTIGVKVANADVISPTAPSGLVATAPTYNQVNLSWTASTDNTAVTGYYIVRNGVTVAQTTGNTYTDNSVSTATSYSYYILAFDAAGNISTASNTATITIPYPPDTTPPSQPTNLVASVVSASQINLSWSTSTDIVGVTGYDVYRGDTKIANITTTNYGDTGLTASTNYSYYVIARDAANNSSVASATVTATTQAPPASTGQITGVVSKADGTSIAGAKVALTVGGSKRSYITDSTGRYLIPTLPPASYKLTFSASGYTSSSVTTTVTAGSNITLNMTLQTNSKKR